MNKNTIPETDSAKELRELLTERLLEAAGSTPSIPLSCAQHRLWFLEQLEPNTPVYNIPCVTRLKGALNVEALQRALNDLATRHESLRTRFSSCNGEPVQVVDQTPEVELELQSLPEEAEADRQGLITGRILAAARRPFNLAAEQLIRATLIRSSACEHYLVLNMHHIISDEWSLKILFRDLGECYRAAVEGQAANLPDLPIQYGDYALWQKEWLKSAACEHQVQFWRDQLQGQPAAVKLPTDRPRPVRRARTGAVETAMLGAELTQAIQALANQKDVTLFMLLLAAFKALLHRYTQQQDIIVGSPIVGRNRLETENLIGLFVNTVALRTRFTAASSFEELLGQTREVALGVYSNQDLPFEKVVEALHPARSMSETPFISVMFLTPSRLEEIHFPGLTMELIEQTTETSKFDLSLGVQENDGGMVLGAEYSTELFEPATIKRLMQHYESLLQGIVAQPTARISELPLLTKTERRRLLVDWSPPITATPPTCLHHWFESLVERHPNNIAVTCGNETLTYQELNVRANQLAHRLQKMGVGPEVPVALHLERSLTMVIAILAVLKAGGFYVPTDPHTPAERLSFMLEDTQAPVMLTCEPLRAGLPPHSAEVLCLDAEWERIATEPITNPHSQTKSDNAAYVIYTSGSTGKPKGVVVTHYNVVRLFKQTESWYGFGPHEVWTLFHAYTFDFSVWELWGALLFGGRLVVVPYLVARTPCEFYRLLADEKVTVLNQTPSAFRQLIWAESTAEAQLPLNLRYVIFGGEALELQSLKPWFDRHGDHRPTLVNMYGITETTVHVTYRVIRQADLSAALGSVIGIPISDLRVFLLDENLEPVPTGVTGEICVAGAGVARGYLNRPELTAQKFILDPVSGEPDARLYRSGDLARYTARGELEYLGRMDHQVKIRGFRVELGEIESALNSHPGIRESVVVTAEEAGGGKRLAAYIVPVADAPASAELREALEKRLPDYMVPAVFIPLAKLPLTPNGKVDRRALPSPNTAQPGLSENFVAPRNPTETALAQIWCGLLNRSSVGVHDNFFYLGGHSLLATQVMWRINGTFNVELSVRALFEAPTISALAEIIGQAPPSSSAPIATRVRDHKKSKVLEQLARLSDADFEKLLESPQFK